MTVSPPRVFVSYSHDSAEHKSWVLKFATTLRNRGIDAILDQWDLRPGEDLPQFMEQNLAASDYAVMVCTRRYVEKANAGQGGVGYEKMIMTSSSLSSISDSKVIPVIREKGDPSTPTFLASKLYVDFTDDSEIEFALDELLRVLLNAPLYEKPEIGIDPFRPMETARPNRVADGIRDVMVTYANLIDKQEFDYLTLSEMIDGSLMHRLTLEKYLGDTVAAGLLIFHEDEVRITKEGLQYVFEQGIVEE